MSLPTEVPPIDSRFRTKQFLQDLLDAVAAIDGIEDISGLQEQLDELGTTPTQIKSTVVEGTTKETNIAVAGIKKTEDTVLSVVRFDVAADTGTSATGNKVAAVSDVTSEADITSDGNIQLDTTNTTGDSLLVLWFDAA